MFWGFFCWFGFGLVFGGVVLILVVWLVFGGFCGLFLLIFGLGFFLVLFWFLVCWLVGFGLFVLVFSP